MESFAELRANLRRDEHHRLMLGSVPMLVMPRWFFTDIMTRVEELAGPEVARQVYYDAGFMGAVKWCGSRRRPGWPAGRCWSST